MENIQLSDFKIIPLTDSVKRLIMSDEEYFSPKYGKYLSNSRIQRLNPKRGGSLEEYKTNKKISTSSLSLGSCVHEVLLQSEDFELGPVCDKPTAKLGDVADKAKKYRKSGKSIYESIKQAIKDCDYYGSKTDDKSIKKVLTACYKYYLKTKNLADNVVLIDNKSRETAVKAIASVINNKQIQKKLHPSDSLFGEVESYNEDALFMNYCVIYKDEYATILKFKMKADNWTIDTDAKVLTLNDVKTCSCFLSKFMYGEDSHFSHYCYSNQMA